MKQAGFDISPTIRTNDFDNTQPMSDYDFGFNPELRRRLLICDQVDSTNRVARDWAADGAASGMIVLTDFQSDGKGRMGRTWSSPRGSSILLSTIVDVPILQRDSGRLAIAAACAVRKTIADICVELTTRAHEVQVKWPNDILLNTRKCAGILIESTVAAGIVRYVVGIGLNVHQKEFDEDVRLPATSISQETRASPNRTTIVQKLIATLDEAVAAISTDHQTASNASIKWGHWDELLLYYRDNLYGLGTPISFMSTRDNSIVQGIFRGVTDKGSLLIENGEVVSELWAGDVQHGIANLDTTRHGLANDGDANRGDASDANANSGDANNGNVSHGNANSGDANSGDPGNIRSQDRRGSQ